MSFFGQDIRTAVSIGLGGLVSFFSGNGNAQSQSNLLTEIGDNLIQENGSLILLE